MIIILFIIKHNRDYKIYMQPIFKRDKVLLCLLSSSVIYLLKDKGTILLCAFIF